MTRGSGIAKEQLTAYQRWELVSFNDTVQEPISPDKQSIAPPENSAEQIAAQLHELRQQAQNEGYAAGMQAGHAAGQQQVSAETEKLQKLMLNLQVAINQFDEQLAQSLLDLSLEIAKKMLIETLQVKQEVILKIVSTAIANLPHFNQNAHLVMHPIDAELVRKNMGEQLAQAGWKIFTDEQIEQGGCRVETAHTNIDATNPARWNHIVKSIGQDNSWMIQTTSN